MISWPSPEREATRLDADAGALLAIARARQSASPTAQVQARLPAVGSRTGAAFAAPVAVSIARWHE